MTSYRFGRDARLSKKDEFERVISKGRKIVSNELLLWSLKRGQDPGASGDAPARIGISVSRKTGGATRRNRLKRLLRESFRLHRPDIAPGYDLVAYPRVGCRWENLKDAEESFLKSCRRAGIVRGGR